MYLKQTFSLCLLTIVGLFPVPSASAPPDVTLWVVQPPGQLVAFDLSDFSRIGGVRIPAAAFQDPSKLSVNGRGQFLVHLDDDHLWVWDGAAARMLPAAPRALRDSTATVPAGRTPMRQWLLGDDGKSLFVMVGVARAFDETGADTSQTPLRMRETDLFQRPRGQVFAVTTRACRRPLRLVAVTEPCPDPTIWAPGGVVRGCAVLTHWEQVDDVPDWSLPQATCRRTRYLLSSEGWRASELENAWSDEPLLDISSDGSAWVQNQSDDGCCGWSNGSSDQTTFGDADTVAVVFDEWSTYHNQDYDVSFFTADARIAPAAKRVAFTVHATDGPKAEIRPSADGHGSPSGLKSIRASLADLPLVEIVETRPRRASLLRLPHAELVGWASDSEVVVIESGHVSTVDVLTKRRRRSEILVRTAADALVVWR